MTATTPVRRRSAIWWIALDAILLALLAYDASATGHPARAVLLVVAAGLFAVCAATDPTLRQRLRGTA